MGVPPVLFLRSSRHEVGVGGGGWFYQLLPVIFYETPEPSEELRKKALSVLGIKNAFQQPASALALGVLGLGAIVLGLCWVGGAILG
jgi:hypothetical protein